MNEDDFIRYSFYTLRGMMVEKTDTQFRVHFQLASYEREDLTEKFFSESMEKKYENKEAKKRELRQYVQEVERTRRCDECGKEINVWDGDITEASIGKALCHDCLLKHLNNLYVS